MTKRFNGITDKIMLKTIMNHSEDMICFKDIDSKIIASSKAYALLRGEENNSNISGKTDFDYFPYEVAMNILKDETNIINTGMPKIGMLERVVKPDGDITWLSISKHPLYDKNKNIIGTWGLFHDITSLKDAEKEFISLSKKLEDANAKLKTLSAKDSLSGLYNQGHFFEELKERFELYKRRRDKNIIKDFSLIIFDVDEFVIILTDTNLIEAKKVAEKLREKVECSSIKFMDKEIKLTASMGVSTVKEVSNINEMIKLADERLYHSKNEGKNRVC